MSVLVIGGVEMPPVQKLTVSREPVWSKNTGRVASGDMKGDIVAVKIKLNVVFSPMSDEQAAIMSVATRPAFFTVKFTNPESGKEETRMMYAGSATYPVYSYADGLPRYVGTAINFIEQ